MKKQLDFANGKMEAYVIEHGGQSSLVERDINPSPHTSSRKLATDNDNTSMTMLRIVKERLGHELVSNAEDPTVDTDAKEQMA